jgi:hypothetical protein
MANCQHMVVQNDAKETTSCYLCLHVIVNKMMNDEQVVSRISANTSQLTHMEILNSTF